MSDMPKGGSPAHPMHGGVDPSKPAHGASLGGTHPLHTPESKPVGSSRVTLRRVLVEIEEQGGACEWTADFVGVTRYGGSQFEPYGPTHITVPVLAVHRSPPGAPMAIRTFAGTDVWLPPGALDGIGSREISRAPPVAPYAAVAEAMAAAKARPEREVLRQAQQSPFTNTGLFTKPFEPDPVGVSITGGDGKAHVVMTEKGEPAPLTPHGEKLAALRDAVVDAVGRWMPTPQDIAEQELDASEHDLIEAYRALRAAMAPPDPVKELREATFALLSASNNLKDTEYRAWGDSMERAAEQAHDAAIAFMAAAEDRWNRAIAALEGKS